MLKPFLFAALSLAATPAFAQATAPQCSAADVATTTEEVHADGLVAQYIRPNTQGRHPALLILGGSEGGTEGVRRLAAPFAAQGYAVLALSYFGAEGLPQNLDQIPLEYFATGLRWLAARREVDAAHIGVFGISKGGEAALLVASRNPQIRATVAGVPSNVSWQGIIRPTWDNRSSWSEGGRPLAWLSYDFSHGFTSVYALYENALANVAQHPDTEIPVERINGPVLLLSGRADRMWPSSAMSDAVVARLRAHNFRFPVQHLAFDNAGHAAASPPSLGHNSAGPDSFVGGTEEGNATARAESWRATLCFFRHALGPAQARR